MDTYRPIETIDDLRAALSTVFAPFGLTDEEVAWVMDQGAELQQTVGENLVHWAVRARGCVDIVGMAAAYLAVHSLFARYNSWLHAELHGLAQGESSGEEETTDGQLLSAPADLFGHGHRDPILPADLASDESTRTPHCGHAADG